MNELDTSELARELERTLPELAAVPRRDLLEQTLRQVAATSQRTTPPFPVSGSTRRGWSGVVLAVAGVLAGIVVGGAAVLLIADRPPASGPSASASPGATPTVASSATVTPTAAASHDRPAQAAWEQIDMPDPAIGMLGGGQPSDVVAFDGGYVVVGSLSAACASDITLPPPGCDEALSELTSDPQLQAAVVWLSPDGRSWELLPHQAAFDSGAMHHAATDGTRIVVTGQVFEPSLDFGQSGGRPVVWVSDDGRAWELVDSGGAMPEKIVWTANGFVGVRSSDAGPQFFASDDGRSWQVTTNAGDLGPGQVEDLAVGEDGHAIVAVGYHEVANAEGLLDSSTAAAWRSPDGRTWERAPDQEAFVVGPPSYTHMFSVARTASRWVALGTAPNDGAYDSGAWTSPDGLRWTRISSRSSPVGADAYANAMAWTGEELVAIGTNSGLTGSVAAVWVSTDGTEWNAVDRQLAPTDGTPTALIADSTNVLAVGSRQTETDQWVGVVYLATR